MRILLRRILAMAAIVSTVVLTGCSTAGPFVTNISSDGRGNLIIEKSMVKYNGWTGTVSNDGTTTTTIRFLSEEQMR